MYRETIIFNNIIQRRRKSEYEFTPSSFYSSQVGITEILLNYNYAEVTSPVQTT